jgi:peptidyl-prolyl cis-trans isomerase D
MKPGDISGPIESAGNGAVLSLLEVQSPTDADFAAKRDQIQEQLLQGQRQELFGLFVNNVRDQMEKSGKIKINQEELKALTRAESEAGI